jgi:hypothetical protein
MKRNRDGTFAIQSGQYISDKGYWRYSAGVHRGKYVHRVLMEKHLRRKLRKDEVVHHRNGNRLDNGDHWDGKWNLEVMGEREHNAVSAKQYWFLATFIWPLEKKEWDEYHANVLANPTQHTHDEEYFT